MLVFVCFLLFFFFFSSRRRHTRCGRDWSSDVCSSDLARRNRSIIRCAPSSTKRRAISRPPWPTWTKSSTSIPIIRMHCSEKNFSKRNCTHHRHHRRRHPVPFLILTCVRQPPRLQHRLPSPKQGTALDCPECSCRCHRRQI